MVALIVVWVAEQSRTDIVAFPAAMSDWSITEANGGVTFTRARGAAFEPQSDRRRGGRVR